MIGNITLTYKPIEGLTITNNAGTDFTQKEGVRCMQRGL